MYGEGSQEADTGCWKQTSGKKTLKMREVLQINCNALEGVKEKGPRVFPIIFSAKKRENERIRLPILLRRTLQDSSILLFSLFFSFRHAVSGHLKMFAMFHLYIFQL